MKASRARAPSAGAVGRLNENIVKLVRKLDRANVSELAQATRRPWRYLWTNFLAGLVRGFGLFLGAGVMGAVLLALLSWLVYHMLEVANMIPFLGQLARAVKEVVKQFLQQHPAVP